MDRVQAMTLIKEIASKIPELEPQSMSITEGDPINSLQTGCTIHFKGLSNESKEQIKTIVENRSLAILDCEDSLSIYTPALNT
jgi:hypothetical protein